MFRVIILSLLASTCLAKEKKLILDTFFGSHSTVPHLEQYNVDKSQISVSGISSGAAFATQIHVIYSSHIMGIGMVAGVPYACTGGGSIATAMTSCMTLPSLVSVTYLETLTADADLLGTIDHTAHLSNDKIWIFDGINDTKVNPGIGPKIKSFYAHFSSNPNSNIKTVFNINAEHGMPTKSYGAPCDRFSPQTSYLNNCNFSAAYDLLNFIYGGNLVEPKPGVPVYGQLKQFNQKDLFYFTSPSLYSMDDVGYVYVPKACADKTTSCKLHVAFHGCKMGRQTVQEAYVQHAGYNEVAELNNIIILYPQVIKDLANPQGCWDWWGYTGLTFATKNGFQPTAIKRMIDKITG